MLLLHYLLNLNDKKEDIENLCKWIVENMGINTPIHFSAYHPDFKAPSQKRTPAKTLDMAYNIAKQAGIYFPYVGNIYHEDGSNTLCPNCGHLLIARQGYSFKKVDITENKTCPNCNYDLAKDIIGDVNKSPSHRFSFF